MIATHSTADIQISDRHGNMTPLENNSHRVETSALNQVTDHNSIDKLVIKMLISW